MRIAMFMPSLGPHALGWQVHRDFAAAVETLGHQFQLLTTPRPDSGEMAGDANDAAGAAGGPATENGDGEAVRATADGPRITVLDEPPGSRAWGELGRPLLRTGHLLPAAAALARHLKAHGDEIDLLHLEVAYPHATAGALAAWRSGWRGPIAVTPMGEDILTVRDRSYGMRRYPLPSLLVNWTLRRAAALRCISPLAERQIAKLSPDNPRRVIPLSIAAEASDAATMDEGGRQRFRARARARVDADFGTTGRPLVLAFGRLHPFKGIDYLVRAAASIGDATVLVVGPSMRVRPFGDVATNLKKLAKDLEVDDKVAVVGGVHPSRALEVLAAADVVVVPSPLESLNKVCMEAAAVGTPFVVTETTGISAWVPDEGVGIVVPPRNVPAIAWAVAEILDGHFAHDPGEAARFARRFSPQRIATRVVEFYEEVTGL
jgi:glycosyltransferase involved in cell wall biosynthesis